MTTDPTDDRARLTALTLIHAKRRNNPDMLTRTLTALTNDPEHHLDVTNTLATITASIITAMHNAGTADLADQLLQQWINPDQPGDTTP